MVDDDAPPHVEAQQARAGATPHVTRYVLAISLALLVIAYAIIQLV
ncbi:MAG: hypothetical protein ACTHMG_08975 [Sphingomonas sp.]